MPPHRSDRGLPGRSTAGTGPKHPLAARGGVARTKPLLAGKRAEPALAPTVVAAPGPEARTPDLARLEAVLLTVDGALSARKLAQFAGLADGTSARTLIRQLNQFYDQTGTAFRVEEVAGGHQLLTRPKFSKWLRRLFPTPVETRLSGPALETLAVVAYRQPVLRADVEAVRGVQCGEMLRQLLERDLIRIGGRANELGRPFLYTTTKRFLQVFGLRHLDDLPRAEFLRPSPPSETPATGSATRDNESNSRNAAQEESEVSIAEIEPLDSVLASAGWEQLGGSGSFVTVPEPRAEEDDDDFDDDDDLDDEDDDEEEDDDFDDEDDEDDDWEEVDDEDDDLDEEDDEDDDDEDWDDDEDDDWDDDEDDDLDEDEGDE